MKTVIQTPGFTANEQLLKTISKKIEKLEPLTSKVVRIDVCLKIEKSDSNESKVCEIKLLVPGDDLFAMKQAKTFEEATDKVVDALKRQLLERKKEYH